MPMIIMNFMQNYCILHLNRCVHQFSLLFCLISKLISNVIVYITICVSSLQSIDTFGGFRVGRGWVYQ